MPEALETIQQRRNERHLAIMEELFNLKRNAASIPGPELSNAVRQTLTEGQVKAMHAREAESYAQRVYDEKREEFEMVEEAFQQEILARKDEILGALFGGAKEQDAETMLRYAQAPPGALLAALDMARTSESLEAIQMIVLTAYERDLEDVTDRVVDLIEETGDLLAELSMIDAKLEDLGDAGALFETLAPQPPNAEKIL